MSGTIARESLRDKIPGFSFDWKRAKVYSALDAGSRVKSDNTLHYIIGLTNVGRE
jgi:hypothetical protein